MKNIEDVYPSHETRILRITKMIFDNGYSDFAKVMWRMAGGSRTKAYGLGNSIIGNFGYNPMTIEDFDDACAKINGGLEVEWDYD